MPRRITKRVTTGGALLGYRKVEELGVSRRDVVRESTLAGETEYRIACCLARLGEDANAEAALERALGAGFRDLDRVRADDIWAPLRATGRVHGLLGIAEGGALSRAERWRLDIEFFAQELKRRAYDPWRTRNKEDFSSSLAALAADTPQLSDAEILVRLLAELRHLGDGHAFVAPSSEDEELNLGLPVKFYAFEEGVFVTATAPEHSRLLGAQLLEVDGNDLDVARVALDPVISRDNSQQVKRAVPELFRWTPVLHALDLNERPDACGSHRPAGRRVGHDGHTRCRCDRVT